jgi:hypothetical protein
LSFGPIIFSANRDVGQLRFSANRSKTYRPFKKSVKNLFLYFQRYWQFAENPVKISHS